MIEFFSWKELFFIILKINDLLFSFNLSGTMTKQTRTKIASAERRGEKSYFSIKEVPDLSEEMRENERKKLCGNTFRQILKIV